MWDSVREYLATMAVVRVASPAGRVYWWSRAAGEGVERRNEGGDQSGKPWPRLMEEVREERGVVSSQTEVVGRAATDGGGGGRSNGFGVEEEAWPAAGVREACIVEANEGGQ